MQALNERADLNPDGFFENYLFMDVSLFAFTKMNAWGHIPPLAEKVSKLDFSDYDRSKFAEFSLCGVHDDRISNKDKLKILKHYDLLSLNTYLSKKFSNPFAIKNPHFAVLSEWLLKKWPKAKFLVCFRNPLSAIGSATRITPELNENIYCNYYERLLKINSDKIIFFSYDDLMNVPEKSIQKLNDSLGLNGNSVLKALSLINPNLNRFKNHDSIQINNTTKKLYNELLSRKIN